MRKVLYMLPFILLFMMIHKWQQLSAIETQIVTTKVTNSNVKTLLRTTKRYLSNDTRYKFKINKVQAQIPYATNLNINTYNPNITRLVLAIHSSSYNPDTYLNNTLELFKKFPDMKDKILIISPAFFHENRTSIQDIVTWSVSPFWGSSSALYKDKNINLSAYEIVDNILTRIITSDNFPNLKDVIILGHSAGGQMVNRYAASNNIETRIALHYDINMKYLVMAPSSYIYFNEKRVVNSSLNKFKKPKVKNSKYNVWGYGLDKLYGYHKRHKITARYIKEQYSKRKVLYLVGEHDEKRDKSLGVSKGAMMQGKNRKERAIAYYTHLKKYFGSSITQIQKMEIIKGAGHWGKALMSSKEGTKFILYD